MTDNDQSYTPADISAANERAQRIAFDLKWLFAQRTGWFVWLTADGRYMASRTTAPAPDEEDAKREQTIVAPTREVLSVRMDEEDRKWPARPALDLGVPGFNCTR